MSMAYQIETDDEGKATTVRYFDAEGKQQQLKARVVVVACSAIESARLLLMSKGKAHPDGIGNHSDQLGRNLMLLGFAVGQGEFSRTDPRMKAIDWSEPFVNRSFQDLYLIRGKGKRVQKGGTVGFLLPHSNPIYRAEQLAKLRSADPLWGKALKDAIRRYYREVRTLEFEVYSETLPNPENRVTLDPTMKDRWGLPVARFRSEPHPADLDSLNMVTKKGLEVLRTMGGEGVATKDWGQTPWLLAGTCRFGRDPDASVLNPDCRVHTAPNVFVADGSFMPTSGGVPNTLTIEANAFRVADRIVELGKRHEI